MKLTVDTPIEQYGNIYVKREDLACSPPGPPFSKVRGLEAKLLNLQKEGINTVGYCDTAISMAGYGVSYFCKQFGMTAIIFYPKYKGGNKYNLNAHIRKWKNFGAIIIPLENPSFQKINWNRSRKILMENWPKAFLIKQGFPYKESVEETAKQVKLISKNLLNGSIVISVGSGIICSGVVRGLLELNSETKVYGITVSPKDLNKMEAKIRDNSGDAFSSINLELINSGYQYERTTEIEVPFPCNRYYDRKAWEWLKKHENKLRQPVIFWNIGGEI